MTLSIMTLNSYSEWKPLSSKTFHSGVVSIRSKASDGSTEVEYLTHHLIVKGLRTVFAAGSGSEKYGKKCNTV